MSIKCLKEFDLCIENPKSFGIVPINIGNGKKAYFCAYSGDDVDPGEEYFHFPSDTLKFVLFDTDGKRIWTKDLGKGVIPMKHASDILSYINENYKTLSGVEEVAGKFFLSKMYLGRIFKEYTGITVIK